jgi:hypothetical protein
MSVHLCGDGSPCGLEFDHPGRQHWSKSSESFQATMSVACDRCGEGPRHPCVKVTPGPGDNRDEAILVPCGPCRTGEGMWCEPGGVCDHRVEAWMLSRCIPVYAQIHSARRKAYKATVPAPEPPAPSTPDPADPWLPVPSSDSQVSPILAYQRFRCMICAEKETFVPDGMSRPQSLSLDHNHSCCPVPPREGCGKCLRSYLCRDCNLRLCEVESFVREPSPAERVYLRMWELIHRGLLGAA